MAGKVKTPEIRTTLYLLGKIRGALDDITEHTPQTASRKRFIVDQILFLEDHLKEVAEGTHDK